MEHGDSSGGDATVAHGVVGSFEVFPTCTATDATWQHRRNKKRAKENDL